MECRVEDLDLEIAMEFLNEAKDLTQSAEESILALESGEDATEHLSNIFRMAHNIKGSGRAVGFTKLGDFVHVFEDVIGLIRDGEIPLNSDAVSLLLEGNDTVAKYLTSLEENPTEDFDLGDIVERLEKVKATKQIGEVTTSATAAADSVEPVEVTSDDAGEQENILKFNESAEKKEQSSKPVTNVEKKSNNKKSVKHDELLKVRLSKLDAIIDSLGELLIYQSMLNEKRKSLTAAEFLPIHGIVDALNGITKEMQDVCINLRMFPLQQTFQKMNRIVREVSTLQKKKVNFVMTGEHIELDKIIVDSLSNPLTHMIRNAIDHGIEPAEERVMLGKPEVATVELSAVLDAGIVRIQVKDDGRGLDRDKILAKAIRNGLVNPATADSLDDGDVFRFIFESGLSTKEQVSDLSGRGVGMDVVRTAIEALSGSIEISSKLGEGTTFSIKLPLSLSIIDGMLIVSEGERFIIPLSQLWETIEIDKSKIGQINEEVMVLNVRNEEIPLYSLSRILKRDNKAQLADSEKIGIITIVDGLKYAIAVDTIIGTQSVVVKDLGLEFRHLQGLSGSAILGDGQPGLILDVPALVSMKTVRKVA